MRLSIKIKRVAKIFPRLFFLSDVNKFLTKMNFVRLALVFFTGAMTSAAKFIAPAAFGRTIEMLAKDEEEMQFAGLSFTPFELLLISAYLSAWLQVEPFVQKKLLVNIKNKIAMQLSKNLASHSHNIDIKTHLQKRQEFSNGFLLIQNSCSQLPADVAGIIYPAFFDLGFGLGMIGQQFGRNVMLGFLIYSAVDVLITNAVLNLALKSKLKFQQFSEATSDFFQLAYESLQYEETIRVNNRENFEVTNIEEKSLALAETSKSHTQTEHFTSIFRIFPSLILQTLIVLYLYQNDLDVDQIDEVIFLMMYFNLFTANLNRLGGALKTSLSSLESYDKLESTVKSEEAEALLSNNFESSNYFPLSKEIKLNRFDKAISIEFKNVDFAYNADNFILKNICFTIPACTSAAIIGKSNSGKSTIAKLLYGLHYPNSGAILLNGVNTRDIPTKTLRSLMAFMPQATDLFQNESIQYNVMYGVNDENLLSVVKNKRSKQKKCEKQEESSPLLASQTLVHGEKLHLNEADKIYRSVMKDVSLHGLLQREDSGEKIAVSTLSGGEKKRICLARALVRHSEIFVSDEPTDSLDSFHEKKLVNVINKKTKDKTSLMITHRLSTIKTVNKIMVLENNHIVESGSHQELMQKESVYKSYWQMQY